MAFGDALRQHRQARRLSQLALALDAGVSTRHLSYLETERASPSREMVLQLADTLQLPLRERNALLLAAGFAPHFQQTPLDAASMGEVRKLVELLLARNEPFGAIVLDRRWDIVMVNEGYARVLALLLGVTVPAYTVLPEGARPNAVTSFFDPTGIRRFIRNWEAVARDLLPRLQRERATADASLAAVLDPVLTRADLPRGPAPLDAPKLVVPLELELAGTRLTFFTTLSSIGTPQDVTLEELRIECLHPADALTERVVRESA